MKLTGKLKSIVDDCIDKSLHRPKWLTGRLLTDEDRFQAINELSEYDSLVFTYSENYVDAYQTYQTCQTSLKISKNRRNTCVEITVYSNACIEFFVRHEEDKVGHLMMMSERSENHDKMYNQLLSITEDKIGETIDKISHGTIEYLY